MVELSGVFDAHKLLGSLRGTLCCKLLAGYDVCPRKLQLLLGGIGNRGSVRLGTSDALLHDVHSSITLGLGSVGSYFMFKPSLLLLL